MSELQILKKGSVKHKSIKTMYLRNTVFKIFDKPNFTVITL